MTLNQWVDFLEDYIGGHAIEGDLVSMVFDLLASSVIKWQTFKLLRWVQNLHQSAWN
jgi:hypothetical protein